MYVNYPLDKLLLLLYGQFEAMTEPQAMRSAGQVMIMMMMMLMLMR